MNIYPNDGSTLVLGRGLNTLNGKECADAMDTTKIVSSSGDGQKVTFYVDKVTDITSLRTTLDIEASASFADFFSASAMAHYVRQASVNRYALFLLVRVDVSNETQTLGQFLLQPEALARLKANAADFLQVYGNEYVAAQVTGGQFIAIFQFVTRTDIELESLSASVSASFGIFSTAADFAQSINQVATHETSKTFVYRNGGIGELPASPADILQAAIGFPNAVAPNAHPRVLQFSTRDYTSITNLPVGTTPITLADTLEQLRKVAATFDRAQSELNNTQYALDHPLEFDPAKLDLTRVTQARDGAQTAVDRIDADVAACFADPVNHSKFSDYSVPSLDVSRALRDALSLDILVHVESIGDMNNVGAQGRWIGNYDGHDRLEGFQIIIDPTTGAGLSLEYMAHLQGTGDTGWVPESHFVGSRHEARRLEGFAVRMTGYLAGSYTVQYQASMADMADSVLPFGIPTEPLLTFSDTGISSDGNFCGSRGQSRRIRAIKVWITLKPH